MDTSRKLGIDEAGKGAVLGDMYIVGLETTSKNLEKYILDKGIKDSKKLSKIRRSFYYNLFIKDPLIKIFVETSNPREIDSENLNIILLKKNKDIVNRSSSKYVYIDCPWCSQKKFEYELKKIITIKERDFKILHKGDTIYKIISMASIVAKFLRDLHMKKISEEKNIIIGSGYPGDIKTINYILKHRNCPLIRKKWALKIY